MGRRPGGQIKGTRSAVTLPWRWTPALISLPWSFRKINVPILQPVNELFLWRPNIVTKYCIKNKNVAPNIIEALMNNKSSLCEQSKKYNDI
jgi:hypothetical protein